MTFRNEIGRYFMIGASASLLILTGCGGEKKQEASKAAPPAQVAPLTDGATAGAAPGQAALPEGHPGVAKPATDVKAAHSTIKAMKDVKLSDDVKKKWNEVKLEITDSSTKSKETVTAKVGGTVVLKRAGFTLKIDSLVPDYTIGDKFIETRSNEAKNPAVLVELLENGKMVAKGWVFKHLPEFNSYTDDRFPLALLSPGANKPTAPAAPADHGAPAAKK